MQRALMIFTGGAFVTLLVESTDDARPLLGIALASVFALPAVVAFGWIDRQEPRRRRRWAVPYVLPMLALGYLVFGTSGAGVGHRRACAPRFAGGGRRG